MRCLFTQPWFVLLSWAAFSILPAATVVEMSIEDGPVEALGAVAFFGASVLFFMAFLLSRRSPEPGCGDVAGRPNFFLLLLALAFLFGAGEEVSWGQRVVGWQTPEAVARINVQNETTIHNLDIFQEGRSFSFWFNAFWMGFCVGVPVLARWQPAREFFETVRLPVLPVWTGMILLTNYGVFKLVASDHPSESELRHAANELKETTIAVVFVWIAWFLYQQENRRENQRERGPGRATLKPQDRDH